ncbi:TRAP dicarboxylate transporter- DctP subunit [Alkaliphilus metalliredigens QYMF]|uniref:TRAP dicarboxylate transporter-DctP subunit n=1 Tax=Alkaliphilus metalliredigens (strain QYMF) TaxID=293826 RepID=A6TUI1_ALKMQ|nr:TRAP transporter substrate-binding protein DctP [Alkaliphilus metalliredigens]ABR49849.1 TRAP dicarboxylate transporter- DctP subunit [Alkaliphilus metalliredigens QYMF]
MKKRTTKLKKITILLSLILMMSLVLSGCGGGNDVGVDTPAPDTSSEAPAEENGQIYPQNLEPKFASEEIEGDFMTVWAEHYADEMREWSNGQYDVTVYPYGTLGDTRDINQLAQYGVVEYVFTDFAWISAFVPEAQVLALHYLWPEERLPEVIDWVVRNGDFMEIMEQSFRRNGLVPLSVLYEGWQWITANEPIRTIDDMAGFKVRIMGSTLLVEDYQAYGAVPTPMDYGEVYGGLQMGVIDGQINPLFAIRSMNFYEVQDYMTQIYAEPFLGIPTVNMSFFDSLPVEAQEKMREWWIDAIIPAGEWIDEKHEEDLAAMLADRPNIEIIEIRGEELKPFQERAATVYPKFVEIGGEQSQEILDALQKDIEAAKQALGIN